jgi:hypothetical protein
VLQASGSFEIIEMQEFPDFENLQFVKNTKFSKFSQNFCFYYRDLRPKKKLLHFTQRITKKKLAEIEEPMVPDRDMAGCFRKYLPNTHFSGLRYEFLSFLSIICLFNVANQVKTVNLLQKSQSINMEDNHPV